jgi:cyclic-di-GMP phosphodiesterase TipF (flagellum assembly factor)
MAPEQSVEASLSALRVAAETMRAAQALRATEPPAPGNHEASDAGASVLEAASVRSRFTGESVSMPPPVGREHARMAAIAEAISAGRLEVLLQPILGLGNQRSGHFEVTFRLRASNGELIELDDEAELQRTGLLPLFDAAKIARASNIALRLSERGKTGSLFSGQNRESVTDDTYLAEIAAAIRTRPIGAGQLVMTFSQADVRVFEAPEWNALADLNALGFRFALSGLTDLDMDFDALTKAGFGFAKLEADMFLEGLRAPEGLIPASDLCLHLADRGLALVVEKIDDQNKLARIFGFGVLFGQGQLFGAPRPVKAEAATSPRTAAA